jgi:hypothetical protein
VNGYQRRIDGSSWVRAVMITRVSQRIVRLDGPGFLGSLLNSMVVASLEGMGAGFVAVRGEVAVVFSLMALMAESTSVLEVAGRKVPSACLGQLAMMLLAVSANMRQMWKASVCQMMLLSIRNRASSSLNYGSNLKVTRTRRGELALRETDGLACDQRKDEAKECEHHAQVELEMSHDQLISV